MLKLIFDKVLSIILIILLGPLFLLIALLIKINGVFIPEDRGPVFFRIARISQGNKISLIKFRTVKQAELDKLIERKGSIDDIKLLEKQNQKLTRIGIFLHDSYLDELPQLFNILNGDISFVGPRPYPLSMYAEDIKKGNYRKKIVKGGLTGLVQIYKAEIKNSLKDESALDWEYIENARSLGPLKLLFYDLRIIAKSVLMVLKREGL